MSHGFSHDLRRHTHPPQQAPLSSLRHEGDLSDWASPQARAIGLANTPIRARGYCGDHRSQLMERSKVVGQTNKQSEALGNTVGPRAEAKKALESEGMTRESGHKKGRRFPSLDCQKSRTFAAIEDYTCD